MDRFVGGTLGRYRLEALLGRGGMAAVYRALDPAFDRVVAVKVLDPLPGHDPQFYERFLREARSTARLQHPHILPVYGVGNQDGVTYLVMRYVEGGTFRDRLGAQRPGNPMPLTEAVALLRPIAAALDYAHGQGIIHRDVKPSNLLLTAHLHPLLADFGIAKVLQHDGEAALTATGMMLGTPEYMSPEEGQGVALDGRADLYALAVVLYEALTGRPPFRADTPADTPAAIVVRHMTTPPPRPRALNPALSPAVEGVLLRGLAKEPGDRYATGAALFDALVSAAPTAERATVLVPMPPPSAAPTADQTGGNPATTPAPSAAPPPTAPLRRPASALIIAAGTLVLLLLLAAGAAGTLLRGRDEADPNEGGAAAGVVPPGTAIIPPTTPPTLTMTVTASPTATTPPATATAPVAASAAATVGTPAPPPAPAGATVATGRREVILFSSHRGDSHDSQIYVMNPDGGGQRQLTASRGHSWGPRLAPDGKQFVFSSVVPGEHADHSATGGGQRGQGNHDVYLADADGGNIVKLTQERSWDNAWSWSPDGRWITFASDRDGNWELYRMDRKGQQVTRLTSDPAQDGWPSWTPDGQRIVFTSDRDGYSQIYSMNADGGDVRRLFLSESSDTFPFVSPDGTRIVFTAQGVGTTASEIYVMDLDGGNAKRLTSTSASNTEPSWSPDGTRLVFTSDRDGNSNIWVMNADGTDQRRLTNDPGEDVTPAWGFAEGLAGVTVGRPASGARWGCPSTPTVTRSPSSAKRSCSTPTMRGSSSTTSTRALAGARSILLPDQHAVRQWRL